MEEIINLYWQAHFQKMVNEIQKFGVSDFSILIVGEKGLNDRSKVDLLSHFIQYSNPKTTEK
jgi:hypothetical protein